MNILFVCKWNRFRSKVAEAIFNKINKNPRYKAQSCGFLPGLEISRDIIKAAKESGFPISKKQQGIDFKLLMWSDIIVIVADDIPKEMFERIHQINSKKVIFLGIKDVFGADTEKRKNTIKLIKENMEQLIGKI
ncbi:MAG TPA: hypothetical protein ENG87_02610 [Candidatus Pacearchaeota archaeon]|nr:low molecular weight phosphotyrosine protein phosphatase [archaeon BMS3Abin17]HDK42245.1 hypothetical protein [Candidatus Pacearchaeota archaeon]HDZ60711.1 hypothetical protein [Candidatus Pacearchaeota archaeon]